MEVLFLKLGCCSGKEGSLFCFCWDMLINCVMYDSYLLKDVHSVLVNFPREYAQESMMLYI